MLTDYQWNGTSIYWHRSSCNWLSLFIEMAPKIRGRASLTVMGWPLKTPLMTNVEFNIGECLEHSTKLGNFPSLVISLIALASSAFTSRRTSLGVAIFNRMRVMVLKISLTFKLSWGGDEGALHVSMLSVRRLNVVYKGGRIYTCERDLHECYKNI